jgi:hypothetical protein
MIEGKPLFGLRPKQLVSSQAIDDGRGARFTFEAQGLRVTQTIWLEKHAPLLRQRVQVDCLDGRAPRLLTGIRYIVPGFCVGEASDCLVQAPGQAIPPDTPYAAIAAQPLDRRRDEPSLHGQGWLQPAPCHTSGLVALENRARGQVASAWLYSEQAVAFPTLDGDGSYLDLAYRHQMAAWLRPGAGVASDGFAMLLTEGNLDEHLGAFRRAAYAGVLANVADVPGWLADARIFQIAPYPLAPWIDRVAEIRDLGFTLLYLCPVQAGRWYVIDDHFAINPEVGTADELRAFVRRAHALGLRVMLDFIPQGVGDSSPFLEQHPDWLVRDALGRTFGSHGWGPQAGAPNNGHTLSLDWGNPDYRRFAVDWALWYVRQFDVDGFRCDAMHWKEPNLALDNPRPAWETIYGGVRILQALRPRLKALKPDAVMLSEVWGPIFQSCTDGSYENGWLLSQINAGWLGGSPLLTGKQYARFLALAEQARPLGYLRANFTANHDMQGVARLAQESPLGDAVSFVHLFARGIPFVMWLEPEGRASFFRDALRQRARLQGYACSYDRVCWEAESVFAALWTRDQRPPVLALANLSSAPVDAELTTGVDSEPQLWWGSRGARTESSPTGLRAILPGGGYMLVQCHRRTG